MLNPYSKKEYQRNRKREENRTNVLATKFGVFSALFPHFFHTFSGKIPRKSRKSQSRESRRVAENRKRVEKSALFFIKLFTPQSCSPLSKSQSREKVAPESRLRISCGCPLCYSQSRSWYWV